MLHIKWLVRRQDILNAVRQVVQAGAVYSWGVGDTQEVGPSWAEMYTPRRITIEQEKMRSLAAIIVEEDATFPSDAWMCPLLLERMPTYNEEGVNIKGEAVAWAIAEREAVT